MTTRRKLAIGIAVALVAAGWSTSRARAQNDTAGADAGAPPPPPAPAPEGGEPSTGTSPPPSQPMPPVPSPEEALPAPPVIPIAPLPKAPVRRRARPLATTVGMLPTAPDFGSEADMVSTADVDTTGAPPKKWTYSLRGFLRAPMRVGYGPRNDGMPGNQLHSPPRIVGFSTDDWQYIGLAPAPTASLYLSVDNRNVSGNLILASDTLYDSGYKDLDQMGGVTQAYVTLKFPDLFGTAGGLAWTVGAFSNRYGNAGPMQQSTGYYGTYLFGRTHVAGSALTADIDLSKDFELIVEEGFGAKLEVIPFIQPTHNPPAPGEPYLPDQGPVPQGSNFVEHAHAALVIDDWIRLMGHFMVSWTPNDFLVPPITSSPHGSMTITGGEVHTDHPIAGSGFVGYSHISASQVLPLADGIQVIHAANGIGLAQNYFLAPVPYVTLAPANDSGTIDTIMFQYMLRLSPLLRKPLKGPDLALAVFGMFNHVYISNVAVKQDKYKYGTELEASILRYLSAGIRFDRVQPDGPNADVAYSALSPRVIVHTNWLSREYVIINYSRFWYGSAVRPYPSQYGLPTGSNVGPDPNLFMISSLISF
jgi:hypothetical protein